jgi:hypothetical protein
MDVNTVILFPVAIRLGDTIDVGNDSHVQSLEYTGDLLIGKVGEHAWDEKAHGL